jgi:hypothetical protein
MGNSSGLIVAATVGNETDVEIEQLVYLFELIKFNLAVVSAREAFGGFIYYFSMSIWIDQLLQIKFTQEEQILQNLQRN